MKQDSLGDQHPLSSNLTNGVFILSEGNFMYGNSSLSFYDPSSHIVQNDLFYTINGLPLGDVAQSMVIRNNYGYIVVNNSGKIYVINTLTGKYVGKITGLNSPRYMEIINDNKAYVTDLYGSKITIIDLQELKVIGSISTEGHPSTEQMVQWSHYLFVSCWSYDSSVLVIDTLTDSIVATIPTALQPRDMVMDRNNMIWTLCDGGYSGLTGKNHTPQIIQINAINRSIERTLTLSADSKPSRLTINATKDTLYYLNHGLRKIAITANTSGDQLVVPEGNHLFYGLGIDPLKGEIYLSDAIDYQQRGLICRYTSRGVAIDSFKVGITPGTFCFKE